MTKWYKTIYAKITAGVALVGLLGIALNYVISGVNWWDEQNALPSRVSNIERELDSLKRGDKKIFDYLDSKNKSYAVGLRVKKIFDEDKGEWIKVKQYRDWSGKFHNIYIDLELSEYYGWEQYYYINPDTHEKIYV